MKYALLSERRPFMKKKIWILSLLIGLGIALGVGLFIGIPLFLVTGNEKIEKELELPTVPESTSHSQGSPSPEKEDSQLAKKVSLYMRQMAIQKFERTLQSEDFALPNLYGEEVRLSDFRGKLILLNFWATWCGPCREEMPSMEKLYQEFKDQNFVILAISIDQEEAGVVAHFVDAYHLSFPILLDPRQATTSTYAVNSIPTTYVVDPNGVIIGGARGSRNWESEAARNLIKTLLETSQKSRS
jgi:peroxiredoxin